MRRTPARRVEPGSALWRGFLASGSSGHDFMRSLSSPRRKVQLPYIIQCIKTAGKLATTSQGEPAQSEGSQAWAETAVQCRHPFVAAMRGADLRVGGQIQAVAVAL